ncbi:MAG: ABC transporter permease [Chloroflexi bacterium]|nr:ABC transporter permease [Chloroflexota bacterium]
MARYLLVRFFGFVFVILIVSFITFFLMYSTPGGPFDEKNMPLEPAAKANILKKYGLDQPFYVQWAKYMVNAVQGDFGISFKNQVPVKDLFLKYWPNSLLLGVLSLIWSFPAGIIFGVIAALKRNSFTDYFITAVALITSSLPQFAVIFFALAVFAVWLKWVPYGGWIDHGGSLSTLILPSIIFGMGTVGSLARYTRSGMLDVLGQDYIRTARAKGVSRAKVIFKHAMRNMLVPIVTLFFPVVTNIVSGSIYVELGFVIPGVGRFFLTSIFDRDYPVVMATVLIAAVILSVTYLLTDIAYTILDPRIKLT